jgi:hypothetical protein
MNEEQPLPASPPDSDERVRITIELSRETLAWIDELRVQLGFRNRGIIIEQLLLELQPPAERSDLGQPRTGSGLLSTASRFLRHLRDRIPFL